MKVNNTLLICCFAVLLFTAAAAPSVESPVVEATFWEMIGNAINVVVGAITTYIVNPVLYAVDYVSQLVIAPIADAGSTLAMKLFVNTMCGTAVKGAFASLNDEALVNQRCKLGGYEEILKAFSNKWVEGGDNSALIAKWMA